MRLAFAAEARADLIRIGDTIALDSPVRALTFVVELQNRCRKLIATPLAYPLVPRYESSGIRRIVHGAYLIFYRVFYRVDPDRVTILHVLHGAMNYEALLFPEG